MASVSSASAPDARQDSPRRIVALIDTTIVSGPGRQLAALAVALQRRDVELHVVLFQRSGRPPSPFTDYLAAAGVAHTVLPERAAWDTALLRRLDALLTSLAPDVVQTHNYKTTALAYALRRTGRTWPWLAFFHGTTQENLKVRLYHGVERRLFSAADRVVVMAEAQRRRLAHLGHRVEVVHNAVLELPMDSAADFDSAAVAPLPRPLIGVIGRLSHEKGVDVFLTACGMLRERGVAFGAVIAGDGPEREALEAQAHALGLTERVAFLGAVRAIRTLFGTLDLVAIPSRSEGLPNVLLEAMSFDRPVVATAVGAVPEVLAEPGAGELLSSVGDARALADGLERALGSLDDRQAREARSRVAKRFSLEQRVDAHLRIYGRLVAESAP